MDHNELFRANGSNQISLAWIQSERIIAASIGLNVIVTLLSIIALITVCRKRIELFSIVYLSILSTASLAISALQIKNVTLMKENGKIRTFNYIGGVVVAEILCQITSFPLFSTINSLFALQYFRAGLTVPLYFDRQITEDGNASHKLPVFDKKIRNRKWAIIASQTVLVLAGLSSTSYIAYKWLESINGNWDD